MVSLPKTGLQSLRGLFQFAESEKKGIFLLRSLVFQMNQFNFLNWQRSDEH